LRRRQLDGQQVKDRQTGSGMKLPFRWRLSRRLDLLLLAVCPHSKYCPKSGTWQRGKAEDKASAFVAGDANTIE